LDLTVAALAMPSSNYTDKLHTRPLVREGVPQEGYRRYLKIITMEVTEKIDSGSQMVTCYQGRLAD
jgi:hypothetical protein